MTFGLVAKARCAGHKAQQLDDGLHPVEIPDGALERAEQVDHGGAGGGIALLERKVGADLALEGGIRRCPSGPLPER